MKKLPVIIAMCAAFCGQSAFSQNYRYRYYFDDSFKPSSKQNAAFTARGEKINNGVRADFFDIYHDNRLIASTEYTDSTLTVKNGRDISYYPDKSIKEENFYKNNKKEGITKNGMKKVI